ncbi:AAA family ATPase [Marinobacter changyiensis]|uniref:AAA family ATPase n=1 Tax=Marinobacter changyiensis TaxID=2604091 RepID=UPI001264B9BF|nr:AAA family ATPase [Marinobacter changyiensis]
MKLQRVRIEDLRQFRASLTLDNLQPGLNLVHGPNESGKSTLVRAIRAAFFERYRSSAVEDLRPWGDSGAAPTVEISFEHGQQQWQLTKQFLQRKRCDLQIGSDSFSGEEAEEKLADLLGYQFAKKGASKAEHWGIPGLLWVEQGTGQDIELAVGNASEHLQSALNNLVGEVASSGGDEVIQSVEQQRAELLTTTGKPRGDYVQLDRDRQQLETRLVELDERIERYQSLVDRLGILREAHNKAERERPWDGARDNLKLAETRFREIETLQQQQQRDHEALNSVHQRLELLMRSREQFDDQRRKLDQRQAVFQSAERALQQQQAQAPVLNGAVEDARKQYEAARQMVDKARLHDHRQRLQRDLTQLENDLRALEAGVAKATDYQTRLDQARQAKQQNLIDKAGVEQLQKTRRALEEETIRSESIATRLSWQLEPGKILQLNGKPVEGQGTERLLDDSTLAIPGIGTLGIMPGGEDLGRVRRQIERLEKDLQDQLAGLSVQSSVAAEKRLARYQDASIQVERLDELLKSVAPGGIDRLKSRQTEVNEELAERRKDWQAILEAGADEAPKTLAAAEADLAAAEQRLNDAEQAFRQHETGVLKTSHACESAKREWEELRAELNGPERQQQQDELDRDITEEQKRQQALETTMTQRKASIDEARPELLQQDMTRLKATIDQLEKAHNSRALEIHELCGRLEAWGAEGLEEQRNELAAELEHVNRRYNELHRRARALDLLLDLLQTRRQALTKRLQAPLQKHLDHYLSVLFPQARLEVNEQLIPGTFTRGNELGQVTELSFGAREQMGLISRLAYADLLQEAGRPTLVILDDTLVHSDSSRLVGMKRILFDASQRHQILLFTCHPDNWRDLGVEARDLEALKTKAATSAAPGQK